MDFTLLEEPYFLGSGPRSRKAAAAMLDGRRVRVQWDPEKPTPSSVDREHVEPMWALDIILKAYPGFAAWEINAVWVDKSEVVAETRDGRRAVPAGDSCEIGGCGKTVGLRLDAEGRLLCRGHWQDLVQAPEVADHRAQMADRFGAGESGRRE